MPENNDVVFKRFFEETNALYKESKAYLLLLEKFEDKLVLTPINELRNAMFHLYEFIENPQNIESDYIKAKEHVYRTCFDTFSLLASIYITKIGKVGDLYGQAVIKQIYNDYYNIIKPGVSTLLEEIAQIRAIRDTNGSLEKVIPSNRREVIAQLSKWSKILDSLTSDFIDCKNMLDQEAEEKIKEAEEKVKKDKHERLLKFLIPLGTLILGGVITILIKKYI